MTNEQIRDFIQNAIGENRVMLFMKGTPEQPPPRTATRRPAPACSSSESRVPIFWAARSVS